MVPETSNDASLKTEVLQQVHRTFIPNFGSGS